MVRKRTQELAISKHNNLRRCMGYARYMLDMHGKLARLNVYHYDQSIRLRLFERVNLLFSNAADWTRQAVLKEDYESLR